MHIIYRERYRYLLLLISIKMSKIENAYRYACSHVDSIDTVFSHLLYLSGSVLVHGGVIIAFSYKCIIV